MNTSSLSPWATLPFITLLVAIAVLPLVAKHWWEKYYPVVSIGLGGVTICYYVLFLRLASPIFDSAREYISFIALVGSLYVIAGGIHIRLRGASKPSTNVALLAIGAVTANLIGTTGASMILIRPYIRVNHYRIRPYHIIFFIFIVSNIGGALTPVGDPPLFVGYLKGIPFFWPIANLWLIWLLAVAMILIVFYLIDRKDFSKLVLTRRHIIEDFHEHGEIVGLHNAIFLLVVLMAVFTTRPLFLREVMMIVAAVGSYLTTPGDIRAKNNFEFKPIKEVSLLFFGIFATMVPALDWIRQNSVSLGFQHAQEFYWSSGVLSSVLDNTPTYLNFISAAIGTFVHNGAVHQIHILLYKLYGGERTFLPVDYAQDVRNTLTMLNFYHPNVAGLGKINMDQIEILYLLSNDKIIVQAISIGSVFFGAMTYIGNGPNFMVKSIAEGSGINCPSFLTYIFRYSVPILLPIFVIIWILFFRA
jgi:Na+/H+ antiporter NhaD/arsenite permease-like protein